jgi:hypothetical protein
MSELPQQADAVFAVECDNYGPARVVGDLEFGDWPLGSSTRSTFSSRTLPLYTLRTWSTISIPACTRQQRS